MSRDSACLGTSARAASVKSLCLCARARARARARYACVCWCLFARGRALARVCKFGQIAGGTRAALYYHLLASAMQILLMSAGTLECIKAEACHSWRNACIHFTGDCMHSGMCRPIDTSLLRPNSCMVWVQGGLRLRQASMVVAGLLQLQWFECVEHCAWRP